MNQSEPFPVTSASDLPARDERFRWLVEDLWPMEGVGIIGGAAKSFKTWLALDLAVSLASKTACLGVFQANSKRRVMVYAAEDSLPDIRLRLKSICQPRGICLSDLDLGIITVNQMHLNKPHDFLRLKATLSMHQPALLILDPFVRLHTAIDENSAAEVSAILGKLRGLQREFKMAIALVHHARKNRAGLRPGQALRGSTDFHAWTDVTLYMQCRSHHLELNVEHRTAVSPEPFLLKLADVDDCPHLKIISQSPEKSFLPDQKNNGNLKSQLLDVMTQNKQPLSQVKLRQIVKARNQTVGQTLIDLENEGLAKRTDNGWIHGRVETLDR
ncbi:MAG: AAA family ATPase [Deltaproteobacteria bacterium]|nr:AAA family ATPase [Deltaproteobacteria bacterium]